MLWKQNILSFMSPSKIMNIQFFLVFLMVKIIFTIYATNISSNVLLYFSIFLIELLLIGDYRE